MRLIKKIEVNYLRSLYSLSIDKVGDMNVIFGRNDSGKSNLLRALNMFFNDKTDPDRLFDFELDMSDPRKAEARSGKTRQFIWIKITFLLPENYHNSLGKEIAIKKQWNRDGAVTQTIFPAKGIEVNQARLTRFLNDIDFTYIPAVKDLNVYADLIERMYGAAAETAVLKSATTTFVESIGEQALGLTEQLASMFGTSTRLAPPTEMRRLFRNLDFAHGDDGHSLLRQKGDGVKARHLPELLRFINENEDRNKLYLWGFEEPENSLDLSAAEIEAGRFADFSSRDDTQVFLTSHSPAFYLAETESEATVRRYFITKQEKNSVDNMVPKNAAALIDRLKDAESKMEHAGLLQLPFIIRRMNDQRKELKLKEEEASNLRAELKALEMPTLFVEGSHDVTLFSDALKRIGQFDQIAVKPLGGTPSSKESLFNAVLKQGGISASAETLFLFDDDRAGRTAYKNLCKQNGQPDPFAYQSNTFVWLLPRTESFIEFVKRYGISPDQPFFTAEFLYPIDDSASLCEELVAEYLTDSLQDWDNGIHQLYWKHLGQKTCLKLLNAGHGTSDWLFSRGVPNELKARFSEESKKRKFNTDQIDAVAEVIATTLVKG